MTVDAGWAGAGVGAASGSGFGATSSGLAVLDVALLATPDTAPGGSCCGCDCCC